jgi:AAA+ superfamily predicted ATPase
MVDGLIRARKSVGLLASSTTIELMAQTKPQVLDEDVKRGMRTLKQLLKNPAKFEEWANETLDMSRLRKQ